MNLAVIYQTVLIVLFLTDIINGAECYRKVQTCPCSRENWMERSKNVTCRGQEKYACVLHSASILVEICTTNFTIPNGTSGCPDVKRCNGDEAEFGPRSKYEKCPETLKGCPKVEHEEYSIYQMYLYPACFITNRSNLVNVTYDQFCMEKKRPNISSNKSKGYNWLFIPFGILCFIVIIIIVLVVLWKKFFRRASENTESQEEQCPLQGIVPDYQNLQKRLLRINEGEVKHCTNANPLQRSFTIPKDSFFASVTLKDDIDYIRNGICSDDDDTQRIPPKDVRCPDDIFGKDGDSLRYVFLRGDAGSGKTIFCMRLLDYWSKAWTNVENNITKEEQIWVDGLRRFHFAFMIPLRYTTNAMSVIDMICNYTDFMHDNTLHEKIRDVIEHAECRCLIILDGLDEWDPNDEMPVSREKSWIPNLGSMSGNSILITGRKWKLAEISKHLRVDDRMIDIFGLDEKGEKTVFENISLYHFKTKIEDLDEQFESFQNDFLYHFRSNPLLHVISVLLWQNKANAEGSIISHLFSMLDFIIMRNTRHDDGETTEYPFPTTEMKAILENCNLVMKNINVLIKLGDFAWETLISKKLVFDEHFLLKSIEKDTLECSLEVGILSKTEAFSYSHRRNAKISFLHKSFQELLAAVSVVTKHNSTLNALSSIQNIFELSQLLTFVSNLSPGMSCEISKKITEIAIKDEDCIKYRASLDYRKQDRIRRLFNLLTDCYQPYANSTTNDTRALAFSVPDVYLNNDYKAADHITKSLFGSNVKDVRSLYLRKIPNDDTDGITDDILDDFLRRNPQLEAIFIKGVNGDRCFKSAEIFNIEGKKAVLLDSVTLTTDSLMGLKQTVSKAHQLKTFGLWDIRYSDSSQNRLAMQQLLYTLPDARNLTTLYISCTPNKQDRETLIHAIPMMIQLQNFQYGGDKKNKEEERDEVDNRVVKTILKAHDKILRKIWLNYLVLESGSLDGIKDMTCIKRIELHKVQMEESGWESFLVNIKKIPHSFAVDLDGTDIPEQLCKKIEKDCTTFKLIIGSSHLHAGVEKLFRFTKLDTPSG